MVIKNISFGREITKHTAGFVHRSHLYMSDKGQPHSMLLCECIRKGVYQPELILHSGSHCLCCTLITNIACYSDTCHPLHQRSMFESGQQITGPVKTWKRTAGEINHVQVLVSEIYICFTHTLIKLTILYSKYSPGTSG